MWNYIVLAWTAWFMGFFPLFEVYLAVPAVMVMGLDPISSVFWASLGNFCAVPCVIYGYRLLERFSAVKRWFERLQQSRYKPMVERYGAIVVLLLTPVIGVWAMAVIARGLDMSLNKLFVSSAVSILLYSILTAWITAAGLDLFA
jgi:uncharacterized membrane protein